MSLQRVIQKTIKSNVFVKPIHIPLIKSYGTSGDKKENNYNSTKTCEYCETKKTEDNKIALSIYLTTFFLYTVYEFKTLKEEQDKLYKDYLEYFKYRAKKDDEERDREIEKAKLEKV